MVLLDKEYVKGKVWFKTFRIWDRKTDIAYFSSKELEEYLSGNLFVFDFKINGKDKEKIYEEYNNNKNDLSNRYKK